MKSAKLLVKVMLLIAMMSQLGCSENPRFSGLNLNFWTTSVTQ